MQTINFVTSNLLKLQQVHAILGNDATFKLVHHRLELPELQASSDEIAINKCITATAIIEDAVLVEDTALTFNSLNGLPGPYIKTFIHQIGLEGLVRILSDFEDKSAIATSTFAYTEGPNQPVKLFTGTMHGKITKPSSTIPNQTNWQSIFQPEGYHISYSMMEQDQKNKISHRYKALMLLVDYLTKDSKRPE
ncbi:MAG: non-canonical purine NTP pyrophosphatase [Candidatus Cardinium sp.]|uniref:non-canonical purine NTP pyrophosphatase n=1 Tax=Cardinium endosymbiont of Dermatophagoides farinae TaxID=2597823 RepID=UPI001182D2B1|nr:non-canonical purine NTP pyrophosphatase [Cardinium endosymbiont of Dermatophagoides farinae]TSJ80729.1 non-canonical purine NTP pyrophosphatase [Cardinium endosymbiont of Dermatophagoides farinae]UWW96727.1 MAG: non-canonical purine NTP pyrophosphatase [Candidatus Cardinium sp.]